MTKADERKWRAESALRTLTEAEQIRGNKQLMGDVKKLATQQVKQIAKVAQTKSSTPRGR